MQLCPAQLMICDVLMLNEPTGHLDMVNIRWLEDRKLEIFKGVKGNPSPCSWRSTLRRRRTSN